MGEGKSDGLGPSARVSWLSTTMEERERWEHNIPATGVGFGWRPVSIEEKERWGTQHSQLYEIQIIIIR